MHLAYLDESGNTGLDLNNAEQPVFCLGAMIVEEGRWQALEAGLETVLDERRPDWRAIDRFEVHGTDLRTGHGHFRGMSVADRVSFRDAWMDVGTRHGVRLIYRRVIKKAYSDWLDKAFGRGIRVNPHVVAFAMLVRCIDNYLISLPGAPLGMLISDENKEIVADVEKSIRVLRGLSGALRLNRIVEKGFFIDSSKSLPLQLCDLFTLSLRKREERSIGLAAKSIDDSGIAKANALLYADHQHDFDVLEWLKGQENERKKEAARGRNPGSTDVGP